ncbi:redoxin domain-containing protein [Pedobacter alpinus]|uniref:Redoxin domain-containing protein n=1 Tax=Pedobacter alpinus TaxID=1590643 RepID=A0ABW5TP00_9SPHI
MKTIIFIISLYSLTITNTCFSQIKLYDFTLEGSINLDTGIVTLELVGDTSYYPIKLRQLSSRIVKGKFNFKGKINQPTAFEISVDNRQILTKLFIIDIDEQNIEIDINQNKTTPKVSNIIMENDYPKYLIAFENVRLKNKILDAKWDSLSKAYSNKIPPNIKSGLDKELKQSYREFDSTLLGYVKENSNSYYALWTFIRLIQFGYDEKFNAIYLAFSDSLKATFVGKQLKSYLAQSNYEALNIQLKNFKPLNATYYEKTAINYAANKFTLLDFWYSNCSPCIAQFKHLSLIYQNYKPLGFEIVGISTDKLKNKQSWLNMIAKQNLKWPQFLDDSGVESAKLGIRAFPSNILLDKQGKVVAVNLLPSELDEFLEKYIKN